MTRNPRTNFLKERDRIANIDDDDVRVALLAFADAVDPEDPVEVPRPGRDGRLNYMKPSNSTAKNYLSALRCAHERGLNLLTADATTVNNFMKGLTTEPARRRHGLVEYDGTISRPSAKSWQSALRAFYRFCTNPDQYNDANDGLPDVNVEWPADSITMFSDRSEPKYDVHDMPDQDDLNAMREACLEGQNTRRDRAFVELVAGTCQRVYALVTLRVGDVRLDADIPHVLLNKEIADNGDKGAIRYGGRWRPIVTDTAPIRQWINNHPLRDPEVRAEVGAPADFDDCYLFVGSLRQRSTDPTGHWSDEAARNMLARRKADTARMHGVKTVEVPANPHNWRHFAYTQSQDLPIDENIRRKVFGWAPGSTTGEAIYGHKTGESAGRQFAETWGEVFDEADDGTSVAEQVVGSVAGTDGLSPEVRRALVRDLVSDDALLDELIERIEASR